MKAWACYWGDDWEWSILILAKTRGKAKAMFLSEIGEWEFTAVKTQRQPQYDGASNKPMVFLDNSDIPDGYPMFYWEQQAEPSELCRKCLFNYQGSIYCSFFNENMKGRVTNCLHYQRKDDPPSPEQQAEEEE